MTTRPYELLVRFGNNGTVAGAHIRRITTVDGKEFEGEPIPLSQAASDPAFTAFAEQFAAAAIAERDALQADLATRTTERDSLQSQVTALTTEKATLTDQLATLTSEKATLTEQLDAANARITQLLTDIPFNPRIIDASKFYDRLTKDEILTLFSSSDATTKQIADTILAYKTNDWPVVFESPEFQQMLGYLMQSGTLTEARMAELTRDATRAEAYDAE